MRFSDGHEPKAGRIGQDTSCLVACHDLSLCLSLARSLEHSHKSVTLIRSVSGLEATPVFREDVAVLDDGFYRELQRFGNNADFKRLAALPIVLIADKVLRPAFLPVAAHLAPGATTAEIIEALHSVTSHRQAQRQAEIAAAAAAAAARAAEAPEALVPSLAIGSA